MLFPPPSPLDRPARVVVTGAGIVSPLGVGWRANAAGFRTGRTAFRRVTLFDVERQRAKTAAEVDLPARPPPGQLRGRRLARLDRSAQMLLWAADEAWSQSGWEPCENLPIVLGTTGGGMTLGEDYFRHAIRQPHGRRGQPTRIAHYQPQRQGVDLCEAFGCQGPITIIANACASGANAVGHAWELLRHGQAERAFAGGYEALAQLTFAGFDSLQALSPTQCRPFDAGRDGLALGEGAAMLALETLEHARRRGAVILGEIVGYGAATDVSHLTQPHPEGRAAWTTMAAACRQARLTPADIDYVNAHGTGTALNDTSEAAAINRWAGPHAATLPVSSTKASIGHLLGAAGALEAVICLMVLREQWLPPEIAVETPDPLCQFPIVRQPMEASVNVALSNSFGFGGAHATLILRRWI